MVQRVVETWQFTRNNKGESSRVLSLHMHAPGNHDPSSKFMDDPHVPRTTPGQSLLIADDAGVSRVLFWRAMHWGSRAAGVVLHCLGNTDVTKGSVNSKLCKL